MRQKKRVESRPREDGPQSGGIHIDGSQVQVGGDMVGGNKLTLRGDDRELEALFKQLVAAIQDNKSLSATEKQEALAKSKELESELKKPEPDLAKLSRLKQFLHDKGGMIATMVSALFQYPPVQETIKTLTQRLLGG